MRWEFLCREALLSDYPPPGSRAGPQMVPPCPVSPSPFWNLDGNRGQLGCAGVCPTYPF